MENLKLSDQFLNIEEEEREGWAIKDDLAADWALDKIRESQAEFLRFDMVAQAKITQIKLELEKEKEKMEREVSFFESKLRDYFQGVKVKETKTQKSYKLPSGTLKLKKAKVDFKHDKAKLLKEAEELNLVDYIKIKKDFDWANFKKGLAINGTSIVDKETGEVIELDGLTVVEKPEEFSVEV